MWGLRFSQPSTRRVYPPECGVVYDFHLEVRGRLSVEFYQTTRHHIREDIVMHRPIVKQRLGKHIPARTKAHKNRTFIARQRISKHASLTVEVMLFYYWWGGAKSLGTGATSGLVYR
jgi:hypothetical protein